MDAAMNPKVFIKTFGCQMNEYDSDKMADVLREAHGLVPTARPEDADVIVFNTCSVRDKAEQKVYRHHTRYPGGLREMSVAEMFERHPERVIELAVKGMMPKNKLGKAMAKKLKVYGDAEHPHLAQKPRPYELPSRSISN
jgi:large subunit ribosomal protein L13